MGLKWTFALNFFLVLSKAFLKYISLYRAFIIHH